jgi:nitroreductase
MPPVPTLKEPIMDDPILSRRSIRDFTAAPVADADLERLLQAAMAAPSAGNQQPWRFVVVTERGMLEAITRIHPYARMLLQAPLAIVVCGDPSAGRWPDFWDQDCSAAVENVLVEAQSLGLGAVWLGVYPLAERVEGLRELFGVPPEVVPFAVVAVGHPASRKPPADRYDPTRVHRERW